MTLLEKRDLSGQITDLVREGGRAQVVSSLLQDMHPTDIAGLLASLDADVALEVFASLDPEIAPDVLDELDADTAALLHDHLPPKRITELLETLPMDDAAEVVAEAGPDHASQLLEGLSAEAPKEAAEVRELLTYKEKTAGRLMVTNYFKVHADETVDQCVRKARSLAPDLETIYTIYVVEPDGDGERLVGVVSLRELLAAQPSTPVSEIMQDSPTSVDVDTDQTDVANIVSKYDLLAVPVLDREGLLAGIITIDDVLDIMVEEFDEQLTRITGSDAAKMARRSPWHAARMRLPWLLGTLVIELCSGFVIDRFSWVLREVILLASFLPVISAVSGNTGLQAAAIAVRGIETGHVTRIRRALPKEMLTSLLIATCVGLTAGVVGAIWSHHIPFGIVIGGGMFVSMQVAGLMGTAIPIVSKRLGFDPAATAGPFETAFQDVIGFAVFLWLASLFLPWIQ